MYITCEEYYEKYLGDNCDNKCHECPGNREIYICKENFNAGTELTPCIIKKGSWWWISHERKEYIRLCTNESDTILYISPDRLAVRFDR